MHSSLYCGDTLEVIEARGDTIDPEACSAELRSKFNDTTDKASVIVCYACLASICAVAACELAPAQSPCNLTADAHGETDNGGDEFEDMIHPDSMERKVYNKEPWRDALVNISWKDIIVSAGESNPVVKSSKHNFSRLIGIRIFEVDIACIVHTEDIALDVLRSLGSRLNITYSGKKTKYLMADAMVQHRAKMERQKESGQIDEEDAQGNKIRINTKRWINVLFSRPIRELLASRGASLTKDDLQDKLSTDQGFHERLLTEYNLELKYTEHVFDDLKDHQDASIFQKIPPRLWSKSKQKFKELTGEYEARVNACHASGFHGKLEDLDEEKLGRTSPNILYLHRFFLQNPDLVTIAVVLLPDGTFCQSSSGAPAGSNTSPRKGGGGKGKGGANGGSPSAEAALDSIASKNRAIELDKYIDIHTKISSQLVEVRAAKRKHIEQLTHAFGDKKAAGERVKRYREYLEQKTSRATDEEDSSWESDDNLSVSSKQEHLLEEYVRNNKNMKCLEKQIKQSAKKIN